MTVSAPDLAWTRFWSSVDASGRSWSFSPSAIVACSMKDGVNIKCLARDTEKDFVGKPFGQDTPNFSVATEQRGIIRDYAAPDQSLARFRRLILHPIPEYALHTTRRLQPHLRPRQGGR